MSLSSAISHSCWDGRSTYDAEMVGQLELDTRRVHLMVGSGRESHQLLLKNFLAVFFHYVYSSCNHKTLIYRKLTLVVFTAQGRSVYNCSTDER